MALRSTSPPSYSFVFRCSCAKVSLGCTSQCHQSNCFLSVFSFVFVYLMGATSPATVCLTFYCYNCNNYDSDSNITYTTTDVNVATIVTPLSLSPSHHYARCSPSFLFVRAFLCASCPCFRHYYGQPLGSLPVRTFVRQSASWVWPVLLRRSSSRNVWMTKVKEQI